MHYTFWYFYIARSPHNPCIRHAISNVFRLYFCFLFARFFSCHLRDWPNHWFGSSCVANATMKIHPSRQTCRRQPNNNNNNQSLSERIYFRRQWARARRWKAEGGCGVTLWLHSTDAETNHSKVFMLLSVFQRTLYIITTDIGWRMGCGAAGRRWVRYKK